ncbi:MAG: hypothetical protein EPN21_14035 [Methylococcaceae bacterium]|nr:MAG: hypothetical protein EPN21_14035 [Methylococcaceae bacterium]
MKKLSFMNGLLAALLLASPMVGAKQTEPPGFEPSIIYQDTDYISKHSQSAAADQSRYSQPKAASAPAERSMPNKSEKPAAQAGESSSQYLVGLVILALAGFIFWNGKQSKSGSAGPVVVPAAPAREAAATGETGVAKYLKSVGAAAETGVTKYLKTVEATAKSSVVLTGVAKYLKNQEASAK